MVAPNRLGFGVLFISKSEIRLTEMAVTRDFCSQLDMYSLALADVELLEVIISYFGTVIVISN